LRVGIDLKHQVSEAHRVEDTPQTNEHIGDQANAEEDLVNARPSCRLRFGVGEALSFTHANTLRSECQEISEEISLCCLVEISSIEMAGIAVSRQPGVETEFTFARIGRITRRCGKTPGSSNSPPRRKVFGLF
jgi:hypothetical protein